MIFDSAKLTDTVSPPTSVCATSIVRTVKLVSPGHFDPTYSLTSVFIWTSVEPSVGIISACLPILRKFSSLLHRTRITSPLPVTSELIAHQAPCLATGSPPPFPADPNQARNPAPKRRPLPPSPQAQAWLPRSKTASHASKGPLIATN